MLRLLIIDDEPMVLSALEWTLRPYAEAMQLQVQCMADPKQALNWLAQNGAELILCDYLMPKMDGTNFLRVVKEMYPESIRMMLSASSDIATIMSAVNEAEVFRYITKPWNISDLQQVLTEAITRHNQIVEERSLISVAIAAKRPLSNQEREVERLEQLEPGITKLDMDETGAILIDPAHLV